MPTAPMPTAPMPTAPMPTAPMPTAPMPTAPMPTAPITMPQDLKGTMPRVGERYFPPEGCSEKEILVFPCDRQPGKYYVKLVVSGDQRVAVSWPSFKGRSLKAYIRVWTPGIPILGIEITKIHSNSCIANPLQTL